ncbi:TlpA disulfide reductase family protein [Winogradskyella maritima]|uniref:TlpA family protein disulfide reductase n=1 Tax=Winogradskyella maritima TaxID=1517766 RepID=A0ABV8AHE7_9FLAO|nr:TlpA disulfide reductase family protein [Winogradskyella maritima]
MLIKRILIITIALMFFCCSESKTTSNNTKPSKDLKPVIAFNNLTKNYNTWWSYHYHKIDLSKDFLAYDVDNTEIEKSEFLKRVMSGNYIVIEVKSKEIKTTAYKLFLLNEKTHKTIANTIKNTTATEYKYFKMEGLPFPKFNVTDINKNTYNNDILKGKLTVIKTWFIACKPCVAEFPELNKLVEDYQPNRNIQFLSLALDKKEQLNKFLKKKSFKYNVIAEQKDLIENKLGLNVYPTHLIIDKKGNIEKVFNKAFNMISYLNSKNILVKNDNSEKLAPPPPPPPPI